MTITKGMILFLVMGGTLTFFLPNYHTDSIFADSLLKAREKVDIKALQLNWSMDFSSIKSINSLIVLVYEKSNWITRFS